MAGCITGLANRGNPGYDLTMRVNDKWWRRSGGIAALLMALAGGCATAPSGPEPEARPGERPPAPPVVGLINNPRDMREDYVYPGPPAAQQSFYWKSDQAEWRIKLPVAGFSYAGFRFLKPHNLQPRRHAYDIVFMFQPPIMARSLWIGLVDGDDQPGNILIEVPLADHVASGQGRGPIPVRIPLGAFPEEGIPLVRDRQPLDVEAPSRPFDWSDVREIRLTHPGGQLPNREIRITDLRFQRK